MKTLPIDPDQPDPAAIESAATYLKLGKVVVHPTDTLYGLAVHIGIARAVQRIFEIKHREVQAALPILIAEPAQIHPLIATIPDAAQVLMDTFWPGPLTIVFPAAEEIDPVLIGFGQRIAFRLPDHAVSRQLIQAAGTPITSTSVNISDNPPAATPAEMDPKILQQVDCLLDGGPARGAVSSTVIDTSVTPAQIIREGTVSYADLAACSPVEEPVSDARPT